MLPVIFFTFVDAKGISKATGAASDVIGIGLAEDDNQVDKPADAEQTDSEDIQNSHSNLALVEFMCADKSEEQAKKE